MITDESFNAYEYKAWLGTLKSKYNIIKTEIAKGTQINSRRIGEYYEDGCCTRTDKRKIERYVRSRIYYQGYTFMNAEDFGDLLCKLLNRSGGRITCAALAESAGLSPNEISLMLQKKTFLRSVDVVKQYEILNVFFCSCFDDLGTCLPEMREFRDEIYVAMGKNRPWFITTKFAQYLDNLLKDRRIRVTKEQLAQKAGVTPDDLTDLLCDNDCPYDYDIKEKILHIVKSEFDCGIRGENEQEIKNEILLRNLGDMLQSEHDTDEPVSDEVIRRFRLLPSKLQDIVMTHIITDPLDAEPFWNYINKYRIPEELGEVSVNNVYEYIGIDVFEYLYPALELFRKLNEVRQEIIFEELRDNLVMPQPGWKEHDSCFEEASSCFMLSVMTRNCSLYDLYKDEPVQDSKGVKQERKHTFRTLDGIFDFDIIECKLRFTSQDWIMWALFIIAVHSMYDLNPVIKKMYKMVHENN